MTQSSWKRSWRYVVWCVCIHTPGYQSCLSVCPHDHQIQERLEEDPDTTQEDIEALKKYCTHDTTLHTDTEPSIHSRRVCCRDFDARVCKLVNTLSDHFRRADREGLDKSSIREAVERLQFYYRIKEELQQWKPK